MSPIISCFKNNHKCIAILLINIILSFHVFFIFDMLMDIYSELFTLEVFKECLAYNILNNSYIIYLYLGLIVIYPSMETLFKVSEKIKYIILNCYIYIEVIFFFIIMHIIILQPLVINRPLFLL